MQEPLGQILQTIESEPKKIPGARVLLFDRLINEDLDQTIEAGYQGRFYNKQELIASIEREVFRLLNTRTAIKREEYEYLCQDEVNFALPEMYGIPDFSLYEGTNHQNWPLIIRYCQQVIGYYEPRLKNIQVTVESFNKHRQALLIRITADIAVPNFMEEVTFPFNLSLLSSS